MGSGKAVQWDLGNCFRAEFESRDATHRLKSLYGPGVQDAVAWRGERFLLGAGTTPKALPAFTILQEEVSMICLLYTSPSPRDATLSRMPSSA